MSRKINEFAIPSDADVANNNNLFALGDPATGQMYQGTIEQAKKAFGTFRKDYTATGGEGSTLTISELLGKDIVLIFRESSPIYEVVSAPDSSSYTWNDTSIGLGSPTNPDERFMIIYKSY